MVSRNFDPPSCLGRHRKTWLHAAVNPCPNVARLDPAPRRKTKHERTLALDKLFKGQSRTRFGIVDEQIDVHRAARICAAGHGGQVLVSRATRVLLEPASVALDNARLYADVAAHYDAAEMRRREGEQLPGRTTVEVLQQLQSR